MQPPSTAREIFSAAVNGLVVTAQHEYKRLCSSVLSVLGSRVCWQCGISQWPNTLLRVYSAVQIVTTIFLLVLLVVKVQRKVPRNGLYVTF